MIVKQTKLWPLLKSSFRFAVGYKRSYQRLSSDGHNRTVCRSFITTGVAGAALMGLYQWSTWRKKLVHAETDENTTERKKSSKISNKGDKMRRYKEYEQNMRRAIEQYRVTNAIPGMICRVQIGDEAVFEEGFGYCNVEQLLSCDPTQSVFRLASISKLVTGVLTIKLASEGKIDLDDSIYKHLKDFPKKRIDGQEVDITIRQLLNHTSGLRDFVDCDSDDASTFHRNDEFVSLSETIKVFEDDELLRKPGSKYDYCSYAFVLLSAVLETVIDKPFHEYIHDFVRQLGMKHTMPEPTPKSREIVLDRLPCYFFNAKTVSLTLVPEVTLLHRTAGGGLISSLSDLCLLGSLIAQQFAGVRNGLPGVKNELFNQILRPPQGTEARVPGLPKKNYSLGFQVYEEDPSFPEGTIMVGHTGRSIGMRSFFMICAPGGNWNRPVIVAIAANMAITMADAKQMYPIGKQIVRETISLMEGSH